MAAALTVGNKTFTGTSVRGRGATGVDPRVQQVLDDIPEALRAPPGQHGRCAEPQSISRALEAGIDPSGGASAARQIRAPNNPAHGTPRSACPTCQELLRRFNITDVYRGRP